MKRKTDIAIAATSARSYNRHWRAHKLSWSEIGKIKYLFDGAYEYMDDVTLAYTRIHFNKLRKALGFKQDSELIELIEKAEAFRIVRNRETHQMDAFMSPLVGDRFVALPSQEIEEPAIPYEIFDCKANALANDNDRDKISENQRQHRHGINMHMLLAGNVPKFHVEASDEALKRIHKGFMTLFSNEAYYNRYFGEFTQAYARKYRVPEYIAKEDLLFYLDEKVTHHIARRVGIENWESDAILKWVVNYFSVKFMQRNITEAHDLKIQRMEISMCKPQVFK